MNLSKLSRCLKAVSCFAVGLLFILRTSSSYAQKFSVHGTVRDTVEVKPLRNAVALCLRLADSTLIRFTRTNAEGFFRLDSLEPDTYQVVISHQKFGDNVFILLPDKKETDFDLKQIILPPKTVTLTEVNIVGYADAVFYKGDTLTYTADSFKVAGNAVVEDLLKKLPGIKVEKDGKIYSQGRVVDQVLVDGDEFFGSDQTIATKNLAAQSLDEVQVYEKKSEDNSGESANETLQVMNLKLKEDAKKGYFGKLSAAGGPDEYYRGEVLLNRFSGNQKISLFGIGSNTPRSGFGWEDINQFGLNNEYESWTDEEGTTWWSSSGNDQGGIPKTLKTGMYYSDRIGEKTKVAFNYTYTKSSVSSDISTASQYFLSDTSYRANKFLHSFQQNTGHSANITVTQTLDSLTELELQSKLKNSEGERSSTETNDFFSLDDIETRATGINNSNNSSSTSWNNGLKFTRSFKNRDRKFVADYHIDKSESSSEGILQSAQHYFVYNAQPDSNVNQKKISSSETMTQKASATYTEPLSKKVKLEFAYDWSFTGGEQDKRALDFSGIDYDVENSLYTNNFKSERTIHRFGSKFIYEVKKYNFSAGARLRQVEAANTNLNTQDKISQTVKNILPYANYNYRFSDNQRLNFRYRTDSRQPDLNKLQPVPDNSNPNYIRIGNPDLLPTFTNTFEMSFNAFKPVSGRNIWSNFSYSVTDNAFAGSTTYDSIGRTVSKTINVQGNQSAYGYANISFTLMKKKIEIEPNVYFNYSKTSSVINEMKNVTESLVQFYNLNIEYKKDTFEFSVYTGFGNNRSSSTLNTESDLTTTSHNYGASLSLELPWKFKIESDAEYETNDKLAKGYNESYVIWNAKLTKTLLKNKNLALSVWAYDMLNQNTSINRNVEGNVISDVRSSVVGRYFMFNVSFKFNSNKKDGEEDEE
jgi:outer membrane receptor protein involved in Fe transport